MKGGEAARLVAMRRFFQPIAHFAISPLSSPIQILRCFCVVRSGMMGSEGL